MKTLGIGLLVFGLILIALSIYNIQMIVRDRRKQLRLMKDEPDVWLTGGT